MADNQGMQVLDVGCGGANSLTELANIRGNFNIDIREPTVQVPNFRIMNVEEMTFQDNFFDQVYCVDVLEHVEKPAQALREIKRVLKPGGKLVLGTPNANYGLHFLYCLRHGTTRPHWDHIATWGKAELENLLRRVGFSRFKVYSMTYRDDRHQLLGAILRKALPKSMQRQLIAEAWKEAI